MSFFSLHHLIQLLHAYGYAVLGVVVGLESVGLPLPGESLLIGTAVIAGTTHDLNIVAVVIAAAAGAITGQAAGYWIGRIVGFRLLRRYGRSIGLTPRRIAYGRALFRRHGVKVIIASRFVVLLRTIAALLAGANRMPWLPFMGANVIGSTAWAAFYGFGAYVLGHGAKAVAGPAAIGVGVTAMAALLAAWLYARRHEQRLEGGAVREQGSIAQKRSAV
jgi:membrane protein DedA with SNARE-associated domain